jgi:hypothetical protein
MSNLSRQCCCGEGSPCSAFCCASSYAVQNFTFGYQFNKVISGVPSVDCGQGFCFRRSYNIALTITKDLPFVVTRTTLTGGECCYRGTGEVTITGTVTIDEVFDGLSICAPPYDSYHAVSNTYTFEHQVCACITVRCWPKVDHCTGATAPALQHTLEIGDFVVTCSHEGIDGDCDTCPQPYGPYELRSVGARLAFSSDVACLPAVTNRQCLGWYPRTEQLCGSGDAYGLCYTNLEANVLLNGPFGITTRPECTAGRDDVPCVDDAFVSRFLPTINTGETAAITNMLQSPCVDVDDGFAPCYGLNFAVQQLGGCPAFWSYA